jgi:hypothetical protein
VVSSKSIDQKLNKPWRPPDDHPWRRYGQRLSDYSSPSSD